VFVWKISTIISRSSYEAVYKVYFLSTVVIVKEYGKSEGTVL
jgi:hypothetical protein